jgi:hypothetical protein
MSQFPPSAVRKAGNVPLAIACCPKEIRLLGWHWSVVVHVLGFVHCAVRVPVYPTPHAPVQVPWSAVGLAQLRNLLSPGLAAAGSGLLVQTTALRTTRQGV